MALDTGSAFTVLHPAVLRAVGYQEINAVRWQRVATASDMMSAPVMVVEGLFALGRQRTDQEIVAHALPRGVQFHGLLGIDLLGGSRLTIDFRRREIELDA